jgi:hypothetical protein
VPGTFLSVDDPTAGFVSAGYFLTRPVSFDGADGRPRRIVSLTDDHRARVVPSFALLDGPPGPWPGWREERRQELLAFLSVDPSRGDEVRSWFLDPVHVEEADWDPGGGARRVAFLRETAGRFVPPGTDATIVGLSVAAGDVAAVGRAFGEENQHPYVPAWVERRAAPEAGGRALGFEPAPILRETSQRACSWLCEGLDWDQVERETGLRPDGRGLLATYEDARRASDWLSAQPGLCGGDRWFAWRLDEYPLSA